jgi:ABC-type branched-subunit amino acid transport system permease subunit
MILATLGWGTWWLVLLVRHFAPERHVPLALPAVVSTVAAVLGLVIAVLTLRARRAWIAFALVPLFANGSLLDMPWLAEEFTAR